MFQNSLEVDVKQLTSVIVTHYIHPWADNLQPHLTEELHQEIQRFLLLLANKLHHLEGIQVLTQVLTLFRSHLRKRLKDQTIKDGERSQLSREEHLEATLKRLLLSLGVQQKLTSDLVFEIVNKILVSQVIANPIILFKIT